MGGAVKSVMEGRGVRQGAGMVNGKVRSDVSMDKKHAAKRLVRMYRSREEDVKWTSRGLVGTVINGEPVTLIQNRVEDAGFKDLDSSPLGADKVFIHSLSGLNVSDIVEEAKQFFI
jgi:hypothetical protein